jgi:hypothetical protein
VAWRFSHYKYEHYAGYWRNWRWHHPCTVRTAIYYYYDEVEEEIERHRQQTQLTQTIRARVEAETDLLESIAHHAMQRAALRQCEALLEPAEKKLLSRSPVSESGTTVTYRRTIVHRRD